MFSAQKAFQVEPSRTGLGEEAKGELKTFKNTTSDYDFDVTLELKNVWSSR